MVRRWHLKLVCATYIAPDLAPGWRRLVYLAPKHPTAWVFEEGF
jgi:hypothetical protein